MLNDLIIDNPRIKEATIFSVTASSLKSNFNVLIYFVLVFIFA